MEKKISIRTGQESDIDKIIVLWERLMRFHENCVSDFVLNKDAKQKMTAYLQSFFNSKEKTVFVAEQSNEIVGYIFGLVKKKPPVFEENVVGEVGDSFSSPCFFERLHGGAEGDQRGSRCGYTGDRAGLRLMGEEGCRCRQKAYHYEIRY